ncbi:hypothetical protein A3K48_05705 [candidate division WOR-1 bacterium RIFOXYA12_FULL_52_29]|uniref:Mannosyl-glycoprotein endo-beta-N-acetylglucosamidase-like domain-containing protein n=1 Tax=candidate division WOR-1 bacterium RIFOXYC12_FULL_54_18 TaxID=1802584 RepID=A0A1F4T7B3_UNCSA|nr:MAG: hypothetical protein A3K44_05705 [candidate division WOR-1 bacterium RIFOXYA2_FULL_51_19]OGC18030.1 MAG: hypothetical protein A3K48_05705 [candidate division WOR-1 bacterium RIFOXYA12_FULL_52_29]OGC26886.1 MAG: hypothetical protein A3K32_05700 [candidate division WOR-1 bacterium RIFOXYB2_FULL_45_9]OGC28447.1 MAG: hypothetical protein A3K49_05705 [candidate division WOR-1 bacterium RIFOXYC12_FULL_54_18]OGC31098.1 MAG: hypothetical protein A2346_06915 [candidate division WOR-1 bacterium R
MIKHKLWLVLLLIVFIGWSASAKDLRAVKLKRFLGRYQFSPLRGHEHEILYCADKFGIDYRLYIAIAGAESTYGKRYPTTRKNLTGHCNGDTSFESIYSNIYKTSQLIGTRDWYKKYRKTKNIWDLVYVYKGVPPYDHYVKNLRYVFDTIASISVEDIKKEEAAWLARTNSPEYRVELKKKFQAEELAAWSARRYDKFESGKTITVNIRQEAARAPGIKPLKQNVFVSRDEFKSADVF